MKLNRLTSLTRDEGRIIARFGDALLVKTLDRKLHLLGGTDADRAAAREWCSLFLHEAVILCLPWPQQKELAAAQPD